jgi:hypothetical protein
MADLDRQNFFRRLTVEADLENLSGIIEAEEMSDEFKDKT